MWCFSHRETLEDSCNFTDFSALHSSPPAFNELLLQLSSRDLILSPRHIHPLSAPLRQTLLKGTREKHSPGGWDFRKLNRLSPYNSMLLNFLSWFVFYVKTCSKNIYSHSDLIPAPLYNVIFWLMVRHIDTFFFMNYRVGTFWGKPNDIKTYVIFVNRDSTVEWFYYHLFIFKSF